MFHHLFRGCLSTQRYVARTSLFRAVGAWDENLSGWVDYELGTRLLMHTSAILRLSGTPTVTTFQQEESITGTGFSAHPERWGALARHYTRPFPVTARLRQPPTQMARLA